MLTIEEAIKIYSEKHPQLRINSITDVGDEWIMGAVGRDNGLVPITSPIAINKETGEEHSFFPPDNMDKLMNAKEVNIENLIIE